MTTARLLIEIAVNWIILAACVVVRMSFDDVIAAKKRTYRKLDKRGDWYAELRDTPERTPKQERTLQLVMLNMGWLLDQEFYLNEQLRRIYKDHPDGKFH